MIYKGDKEKEKKGVEGFPFVVVFGSTEAKKLDSI